ncbi:hypothetical protein QTO34_019270 [Cnephaeus nilssonii]|uniref:Uncharacterized protein n=1 Tax=Cnephaeus nilssonii TaxID=3371016 RepID=A0AA40HX76_CNENI|nr:hypothetical protein QTO34_019270 [Eptesicus nilssonii]
MEINPDKAVSIIKCDMNVDFDALLGYKELKEKSSMRNQLKAKLPTVAMLESWASVPSAAPGIDWKGKRKVQGPAPLPIKPEDVKRGILNYEFKLASPTLKTGTQDSAQMCRLGGKSWQKPGAGMSCIHCRVTLTEYHSTRETGPESQKPQDMSL